MWILILLGILCRNKVHQESCTPVFPFLLALSPRLILSHQILSPGHRHADTVVRSALQRHIREEAQKCLGSKPVVWVGNSGVPGIQNVA